MSWSHKQTRTLKEENQPSMCDKAGSRLRAIRTRFQWINQWNSRLDCPIRQKSPLFILFVLKNFIPRLISELIHLARCVKFNPYFIPGIVLIVFCGTQSNRRTNFIPRLAGFNPRLALIVFSGTGAVHFTNLKTLCRTACIARLGSNFVWIRKPQFWSVS